MPIATMTSKGQITVPSQVRADLELTAGTQIVFLLEDDRKSYRVERLSRPVAALAGRLRHDDSAKTLAEMDEGITATVGEGYR